MGEQCEGRRCYSVARNGFGSAHRRSQRRSRGALSIGPLRKEDAPNKELEEAWEYYHTPRAEYPTAPGFMTTRSLNQIITYDAFNKAEAFFTQPLLLVAGSVAGSK
jgi:hypothetical protein